MATVIVERGAGLAAAEWRVSRIRVGPMGTWAPAVSPTGMPDVVVTGPAPNSFTAATLTSWSTSGVRSDSSMLVPMTS